MDFIRKVLTSILFILSIFLTISLKAQFITDTINRLPIDSIGEVELDSNEFEEMYVPEDIQFIPSEVLYHNNWNNKDIKLRSDRYFEKNGKYTLPLVKEGENPFVFPCNNGKVISQFGHRGRRVHAGTDIKLNLNDEVYSAFDGVVRMAKRYSGYGNVIVVRHYNGLETVYGHLNKIKVKVNQKVKAGDVIGLGGRTGRATTTHLHFETRFLGDAFNSNKVVNYENNKLLNDTIVITRKTFDLGNGRKHSNDDDEDVYVLNKHGKKVKVHRKEKNSDSKKHSKGGKNLYAVRQGDTLSEIARKNGTTVSELCRINKLSKTKLLKLGQKLKVN